MHRKVKTHSKKTTLLTHNLLKMNTDTIGTWAGLVWNALNEADVLGNKQIKKMTKLKDKELYAALGWLARENKIAFEENEDNTEVLVTLVK